MKYRKTKGDITQIEAEVPTCIIHGCNSRGVMGAGVAAALRRKWPEIFQPYREFCERNEHADTLGTYTKVSVGRNLSVINLITQKDFGRDVKLYVSYAAIQRGFRTIFQNEPENDFVFPMIGAGLAGGTWEVIEDNILSAVRDCKRDLNLRLVVLG